VKVPLSWLREYVEVDLPPKELAHRLTMSGTEAESVEEIGAHWQRIVVARVTDLERHPGSDRGLWIAKVDRGDGESTIVTGAQNLFVGAVVPLVMAGGRLPPTRDNPRGMEIKRVRMRGVESEGMLCAGDELQISDDHAGIYILDPSAPIGTDLRDYLGDVVLDLYITPNRSDCMSVLGIAREIQALTGARLRPPRWEAPRGDRPATDFTSIEVPDPDLCPRFSATVICDIKIGPSPEWMQRRLFLSGVRPINNVVDITNYVMLELGKPLHAYDGRRLRGGIMARRARPGETVTTLDGQERALSQDVLVIADQSGPIGVAGVMGGAESEINPETDLVVLESADFSPTGIRRWSRELGLRTEASRRFERGLDPDLTISAAARATQLMAELAEGRPAGGIIDVYPNPEPPRRIALRLDDVAGLLGRHYSRAEVVTTLERLDFGVAGGEDELVVTVPGHRRDVERKADLIEEVARITGYEAIPEVIFEGAIPEPKLDRRRLLEERTKLALVAAGCQEIITYSLVHPSQADQLDLAAAWPPREALRNQLKAVFNPMSVDQSALRTTLLGSLLETVRSNLRHRERVWCFELARVYLPPFDPLPRQPRRLALALTGPRQPASWASKDEPTDFFDLKGVLDQLLGALGVHGARYLPAEQSALQPGRTAEVVVGANGEHRSLGLLGQVHPRIAERFDLGGQTVLVAELDFEAISDAAADALSSTNLPRFPGLQMDLALIVDEATSHEAVLEELRQAGGELLVEVRLFDLYRGGSIPEGQKSLAFALTFRAPDRTLTDEEVAGAVGAIELHLAERLGARVRRG
jgi:phenylalanyl-tRNA synthetase beta chain